MSQQKIGEGESDEENPMEECILKVTNMTNEVPYTESFSEVHIEYIPV